MAEIRIAPCSELGRYSYFVLVTERLTIFAFSSYMGFDAFVGSKIAIDIN